MTQCPSDGVILTWKPTDQKIMVGNLVKTIGYDFLDIVTGVSLFAELSNIDFRRMLGHGTRLPLATPYHLIPAILSACRLQVEIGFSDNQQSILQGYEFYTQGLSIYLEFFQ